MQGWKKKFKSWIGLRKSRRYLLFVVGYCLVLYTTLVSCNTQHNTTQQQIASSNSTAEHVVRIVRAKQLVSLAVLEKQGILEKKLAPLGFKIEWPEFAAGPQQLEALNAGGLDIALTAESPPVFSQAAGTDLVYLSATPHSGKSISLLVPVNSPVKSVADLKEKKVACQKASIGHYLLVKAVEAAGLKQSDVTSVFLPPPDANVAFSRGKLDGWFIWEPFVTRAEQQKVGRVLIDGEKLRDTGNFYSTSRQFFQAHPDVIKVFLEELQKAELWSKDHPQEMAELLTSVTQVNVPTLKIMHDKYDYGLRPITEEIINKQQQVADLWYNLKLLPKKVNVRDGFLTPEQYAEITPKDVLATR